MNKKLIYALTIGILIISFSVAYYFIFSSQDTKKQNNKEEVLRQRWQEYTNLIMVGLCKNAYDDFLTQGSKTRNTFQNYEQFGCTNKKEKVERVKIDYIVFTDNNRADIKLKFEPVSLNYYYHWDVETWYLETGNWKRDY